MTHPTNQGRISRFILSSFISFLFIFQATAGAQVAAVQEQDVFTAQQKQQLIDFYWTVSEQLVHEGQYDQAINQAQRIYDIDPRNQQVNEFVKRIKRRSIAVPSSRERANKTRRFISEQEQYSRMNVEGTYLPNLQKEFENVSAPLMKEPSFKVMQQEETGVPVTEAQNTVSLFSEDMDDFVAVKKPVEYTGRIDQAKQQPIPYGGNQSYTREEPKLTKEELLSIESKEKIRAEVVTPEAVTYGVIPPRDEVSIRKALYNARMQMEEGNYDKTLFMLNELLITNADNSDVLELKSEVLGKRREQYEDLYESKRIQKAALFRKKMTDNKIALTKDALKDIEDQERMIREIQKKRLQDDERRVAQGERLVSDDVKKRIAMQESKELDVIITEVEESQFYEKFKAYDEQQKLQELKQRRQVHSFLLRAEGLMEMGKYNEAAVYLNNVFMVDPYNARAQKMRIELEEELVKKELRSQEVDDRLFKSEKKEYMRIKNRVRKDKVKQLYREANDFYDQADWLNARQWTQKILIVDPSNRKAKKLMRKIDKKLIAVQEKIESEEGVSSVNRSAAMDEALQDAARAIELEIVSEMKDKYGISLHVNDLIAEADKKIARRGDLQGALIDLNRAATLDPANDALRKKMKEVRAMKLDRDKGLSDGASQTLTISHTDAAGKEGTITKEGVSPARRLEREAEEKEERWKAFNRGKQIQNSAVRKVYQDKVEFYTRNARKYLDQRKFDQAKKEVERIFLFDSQNQMAKDMLDEIATYEVNNIKTDEKMLTLDKEFKRGIEIEKLKVALNKETDDSVILEKDDTGVREEQTRAKAIKRLLKEGKKLYKQNRYFEAQQKFEAVFALDSNNKKASKYLDKVNSKMLEEREEERSVLRERQRKEINSKLDTYSADIHRYHTEGRYTDAAILIEKGLLLDPSNKYFKELKKLNIRGSKDQLKIEITPAEEKQNLVNMGIKEYIQGNYVEAKKLFEKVLSIDPKDEKALNSIAKLNAKIESLQLGQ